VKLSSVQFTTSQAGHTIAFLETGRSEPHRTGIFWLGGFMSDMQGSKAEALARLAEKERRHFIRFDYSGHGQSGGAFSDGTISAWLSEARQMFTHLAPAPTVIVGSSMGGWLALLLVRSLFREDAAWANKIAGLVLIAPAADMTADLMWDVFDEVIRRELQDTGIWYRPSAYGAPYAITSKLIEDGRQHLMLEEGLRCSLPARVLQGTADEDVPVSHAMKVFEALSGDDVSLTLVKGGDHRLSNPANLAMLCETVEVLARAAETVRGS
jgi:pimeloyl-ACP methyl ester carboxylesterase